MRISYLHLLIATWTVLVIAACKKNDQSLGDVSLKSTEFPLAVGDKWVYQVNDYNSNTSDTITLAITGSQSLPGNTTSYRCDITIHGAVVDSGTWLADGKIFTYQGLNPNSYSYFGNIKLQFPCTTGGNWPGIYPTDTVRLISRIDSTAILGREYHPVFSLRRSFQLQGNYSQVQNVLIAPNIGIINQSLDIFSGGPLQNQGFSLISWSLK